MLFVLCCLKMNMNLFSLHYSRSENTASLLLLYVLAVIGTSGLDYQLCVSVGKYLKANVTRLPFTQIELYFRKI